MSELETAPVPRRNLELLLLLLALTVAMAAYYLVGINSDEGLSKEFITQGLFLAGLALVFHVILRVWAKYADPIILPVTVALNGIGLAMIHRIDLARNDNQAFRQILWTGVAMVVAMVVLWSIRDHRVLRRFTYTALAASIVLLLLPLIPGLGIELNGARIWVKFGSSLTFQPGELAKITLAIFFAGYLSSNRELILLAGKKIGPLQLPRARDLGPMMVAWLVSIGVLVVQRDLGSSILFFGLFMVMIYVATARVSWIVIGTLMLAGGGVFAYLTMSHVTRRVNGWLNAFDPDIYYATGGSRQIVEGLFGMGDGGLLGTGLGNGSPYLVPLGQQRHDRCGPGRRARAHRPVGNRADVPDPDQPRHARGPGLARRLRQTACHRAVLHPGAAMLRGHWRRHPAHPADRPDDAVHGRRRFIPAGELDHRRVVAVDFPQFTPPHAGRPLRDRRGRHGSTPSTETH